eukprot:gene8339-879_t
MFLLNYTTREIAKSQTSNSAYGNARRREGAGYYYYRQCRCGRASTLALCLRSTSASTLTLTLTHHAPTPAVIQQNLDVLLMRDKIIFLGSENSTGAGTLREGRSRMADPTPACPL